ncbi:ABC transporter substrate-binding protein [Spirillospora sp. CA-108201]
MNFRRTRNGIALAAAGLLALGLTSCSSGGSGSSGGDYVIGFSDGLTGSLATYTAGELRWTKAVFNAVNASGGIDGHKIRLKALDQGEAGSGKATANVIQLATKDKATAILGQLISNDCSSVAKVAERYKTPVLCQRGTESDLNPPSKYVFLDTDMETMEVEPQIKFIKSRVTKPNPRVAVFYSDLIGPLNWSNRWKKEAAANGMTVSTVQKEALSATNIDANIAAIVASKPDVVVAEIFNQFYKPLVDGLAAAGLDVPVVTTSGAVIGSTMKSIGRANLYQTTITKPAIVDDPSNSAGLKATLAELGKLGTKTTDALMDGEGTMPAVGPYIVVEALKKCGFPCSGQKMSTALEQVTTDADGLVPGSFGYSPTSHIGVKNLVFMHWDPAKRTYTVAATEPAGQAFDG